MASNSNEVNPEKAIEMAVVEAVKKALSSSSGNSIANINPEEILKKVDTQSIFRKALEQAKQVEAPCEKKHKLYLPPPNTPSYNPTPISQLKKQNKEELCDIGEDEAEFSEVEDSSTDEESKQEFDMLEEVMKEHITNPERAKEMRARKLELAKLKFARPVKHSSSKKELPVTLSQPIVESKLIQKVESNIKQQCVVPTENSVECGNYFLPPSPVFTQSNYISEKSSSSTSKEPYLDHPFTETWLPKSIDENEACEMVSVESMLAKLDGGCFEEDHMEEGSVQADPISSKELSNLLASPCKSSKDTDSPSSNVDLIPDSEKDSVVAQNSSSVPVKRHLQVVPVSMEPFHRKSKIEQPVSTNPSLTFKSQHPEKLSTIPTKQLVSVADLNSSSNSFFKNEERDVNVSVNTASDSLVFAEALEKEASKTTISAPYVQPLSNAQKLTTDTTHITLDMPEKTTDVMKVDGRSSKNTDKASKRKRSRSRDSSRRSHKSSRSSRDKTHRSSSDKDRLRNSSSRKHSSSRDKKRETHSRISTSHKSSRSSSSKSNRSSNDKDRHRKSSKRHRSSSHDKKKESRSCSLSSHVNGHSHSKRHKANHSTSREKLICDESRDKKKEKPSSSKYERPKIPVIKSIKKEPTEAFGSSTTKDNQVLCGGDSPSKAFVISDNDCRSSSSGSPLPDLSALDAIDNEEFDELFNVADEEKLQVSPDMDVNEASTDSEDHNDPSVMEECLQIFGDYHASNEARAPCVIPKVVKPVEVEENIIVGKKRISHVSSDTVIQRRDVVRPGRKSAGQVMRERYVKLMEEQKALQMKLKEQEKVLEKFISKGSMAGAESSSSVPVLSSSRVSSTSGVGSASYGHKKVLRAPANVEQLLLKKNRFLNSMLGKRKGSVTPANKPEETLPKSNPKGKQRIPHVPQPETLARPIIMSGSSKVPQVIRQRYLNAFIEEVQKFCDNTKMTYDIAVAEEEICTEKGQTRSTYLGVAVNTISRLRNRQIRESVKEKLQIDECYTAEAGPSEPKALFNHPINPNHRTVSHSSVLASGGEKGSWSVQNKKSSLANLDELLKGCKFYKSLEKYVMSEKELADNGYPRPHPTQKGKAVIMTVDRRKKICDQPNRRICARCSTKYEVDEFGVAVIEEKCVYHWRRPFRTRNFNVVVNTYPCCQSESSSDGCCKADTHVSDNFDPGSLVGFIKTFEKKSTPEVYAMDCEMCYTTAGNELTRVTVINDTKQTVYDTLVLPDNPIIDYNTRFSGITAESLRDVKISIRDVQAYLLSLFCDKTILIGHSLENDLMALKLIHSTVVDTSVVFPHTLGPPKKKALRFLASEHLKKIIQDDLEGHDSTEDALTCMELMHYKIKEDLKVSSMS